MPLDFALSVSVWANLPGLCFESSQTTHYSCSALPLKYRELGNSAYHGVWFLEVCISIQCPQLSVPIS